MDFSGVLFRCSSLHHIMVEPRSKADKEAGVLSDGVITHCSDMHTALKYGRSREFGNKYTEKGNLVEEDAITLHSRITKTFFKKNEEHLRNDFIMGTPDLFTGESIYNAEIIDDVKSSWDMITFARMRVSDVPNAYYWQGQGYMMLTGAKIARFSWNLVNTPMHLIQQEEKRLFWQYGGNTDYFDEAEYNIAVEMLHHNSIFDDIDYRHRNIIKVVPRNQADIDRIPARVMKCREKIQEIEESLPK